MKAGQDQKRQKENAPHFETTLFTFRKLFCLFLLKFFIVAIIIID